MAVQGWGLRVGDPPPRVLALGEGSGCWWGIFMWHNCPKQANRQRTRLPKSTPQRDLEQRMQAGSAPPGDTVQMQVSQLPVCHGGQGPPEGHPQWDGNNSVGSASPPKYPSPDNGGPVDSSRCFTLHSSERVSSWDSHTSATCRAAQGMTFRLCASP